MQTGPVVSYDDRNWNSPIAGAETHHYKPSVIHVMFLTPRSTSARTNAQLYPDRPMALRPNSFLETIIAFLLPYFSAASMDKHEARSEIIDTLTSYDTRTRAEMLQAAHIIAFGMTTLDVLAEAKTAEMSPSMRLRYRGCANNLNRSDPPDRKGAGRASRPRTPTRPRENGGARGRHAPGRDNGGHSGAQSEG